MLVQCDCLVFVLRARARAKSQKHSHFGIGDPRVAKIDIQRSTNRVLILLKEYIYSFETAINWGLGIQVAGERPPTWDVQKVIQTITIFHIQSNVHCHHYRDEELQMLQHHHDHHHAHPFRKTKSFVDDNHHHNQQYLHN